MPEIRPYNQQIAPRPLPGAQLQSQGTADHYGGVWAKAIGKVTEHHDQIAASVNDILEKERKRTEASQVRAATNKAREEMRNYLYGDGTPENPGLFSRQGEAALDIQGEAKKRFNEIRMKHADASWSGDAGEAYEGKIGSLTNWNQGSVDRYHFQERRRYELNSFKVENQNILEDAVKNRNDLKRTYAGEQQLRDNYDEMYAGAGKKIIDSVKKDGVALYYTKLLEAHEDDSPQAGKDFLDRFRDRMDPTLVAEKSAKLREELRQTEIMQYARSLVYPEDPKQQKTAAQIEEALFKKYGSDHDEYRMAKSYSDSFRLERKHQVEAAVDKLHKAIWDRVIEDDEVTVEDITKLDIDPDVKRKMLTYVDSRRKNADPKDGVYAKYLIMDKDELAKMRFTDLQKDFHKLGKKASEVETMWEEAVTEKEHGTVKFDSVFTQHQLATAAIKELNWDPKNPLHAPKIVEYMTRVNRAANSIKPKTAEEFQALLRMVTQSLIHEKPPGWFKARVQDIFSAYKHTTPTGQVIGLGTKLFSEDKQHLRMVWSPEHNGFVVFEQPMIDPNAPGVGKGSLPVTGDEVIDAARHVFSKAAGLPALPPRDTGAPKETKEPEKAKGPLLPLTAEEREDAAARLTWQALGWPRISTRDREPPPTYPLRPAEERRPHIQPSTGKLSEKAKAILEHMQKLREIEKKKKKNQGKK